MRRKPASTAAGLVLVVGSINVDFVVRVAALPRAGETVIGGDFSRHHGGKGANQAVAAARLGARVAFVGAVGEDDLGRAAVAELEAEGVTTRAVAALGGVSTGVALIVVDPDGQNQIAVASGANERLDAALVERAVHGLDLKPGGVFLANLEIPDAALLAGAMAARRAGMRLVVNPAPARPLPSDLLEVRPLLVPNEGEAAALTGIQDPPQAAAELGARTGAPVVVTLGAAGAILVEGGHETRFPAPTVTAVDTTGAGDTFCGAMAACLATSAELADAVEGAVQAAALSVTSHGARGGMPTQADLERWRAGWDSNPGHED